MQEVARWVGQVQELRTGVGGRGHCERCMEVEGSSAGPCTAGLQALWRGQVPLVPSITQSSAGVSSGKAEPERKGGGRRTILA